LPAPRKGTPDTPKPIGQVRAFNPQPAIMGTRADRMADRTPLRLDAARTPDAVDLWTARVARDPYRKGPRPCGPDLRWCVRDPAGRILALVLFEAAARV